MIFSNKSWFHSVCSHLAARLKHFFSHKFVCFYLFRPSFSPLKLLALLSLTLLFAGGSIGPVRLLSPAEAADQPTQFRYFEQTGHSINAGLLRFYNRTGAEERHGLPLSELISVKGKYQQFFERSILEFNPTYIGTEAEVKQLSLGTLETAATSFPPVTPFSNNPNQWYFPETGHSLSFGFLEYWRNHGERASLGLPLSEEMGEEANGQKLTVQYFEYVRLEFHPEAAGTDYAIQLSLLGRSQAQKQLSAAELAPVPLAKLSQPRVVRVPSLMLHYVRLVDARKDPLGFDLSVTPDNFVKFADWIQQNGYTTVTVAQINDYLRYGIPLPDKPVNLRFDDGHADQWFAYQELKKRNMTATFFIVTQRLELNPAQWQQVDADGFEVAAHTRTHPDLRGVRDLEGEITGSKTDLEAILGHPVRSFAYPYGKYGPTILKVVRDSGFEIAVSTNGGYAWSPDNYFTEPTISVVGNDTVTSFAAKIKGATYAPFTNSTPASDASATKAPAKVNNTATPKTAVPTTKAPTPKK